MKFFRFIIFLLFLQTSLFSIDIMNENLLENLNKEGEKRIISIWLIYETKQFNLLKKALNILITSENDQEQNLILRIMNLLSNDIDAIIPNWYTILENYIDIKRSNQNLLECLKLIKNKKENKLVYSVLRLTKHPDSEIRKEAIQILKELRSDLVLSTIINYLRSNNELLILYGLENSIYYPDKRLIPYLRELITYPDKTIRNYTLHSLSLYENESYYIVRNFEKENDEEVQERIIELIGENKWYNYSYIVNQTITSSNNNIQKASIIAARKLKNPIFIPTISKQLLIENDIEIIKEGIITLSEIGKSDPYRSLIFLLNHKDNSIKLQALKAIQKMNISEYVNELPEYINSGDETFRLELLYTICTLLNNKNYIYIQNWLYNNTVLSKSEKFLILSTIKQYLDKYSYTVLENNIIK